MYSPVVILVESGKVCSHLGILGHSLCSGLHQCHELIEVDQTITCAIDRKGNASWIEMYWNDSCRWAIIDAFTSVEVKTTFGDRYVCIERNLLLKMTCYSPVAPPVSSSTLVLQSASFKYEGKILPIFVVINPACTGNKDLRCLGFKEQIRKKMSDWVPKKMELW